MKKVLITISLLMLMTFSLIISAYSFESMNIKLRQEDPAQAYMETVAQSEEWEQRLTEAPFEVEETEDEIESEELDPEAPILTLKSKQVVISKGESFNVISVVDDITDNHDDRNVLFRDIRVSGSYDVNTPGEYVLEYTVCDSEGHISSAKKLKLIVKQK